MVKDKKSFFKKNLYDLFFVDGVQCFKAAKPLQRDNILFEPTFGQYSGFEPGTPGLGIHHLGYKAIMEVYWKITVKQQFTELWAAFTKIRLKFQTSSVNTVMLVFL